MWVEQCDSEWSEERIFLKVGASWFSLAPTALHHRSKSAPPPLQERSTTVPSQGQFMPMTRNITVYLAIIQVKHM